ncbi:MAG: cold shock domain-containing protein [Nanoarchaeota archaeon]|nr:cold shock domain-containing protein [Nanoarchaeota archaeon]
MEGKVKFFNTRKGFGFIQGDDGQEYFVHQTALPKGTFLRENDRVAFEAVETDRGKQARDITLLQKGSDMEEGEEPKEETEETEETEEKEE